mgnify:CR=1 FL=1|tara:strand:- start:142 stop:318 length:177 start_codon:yes stop_codon:yes gene_type:complete
MVNIVKVNIDNKGRVQIPRTFLIANGLCYGDVLTIKPMVNKKNSVALIWEEKYEKTNK